MKSLCEPLRSPRLCVERELNAESKSTLTCADEAIMQGPGTVYLDWKTPMIGGKGGPVRAYVIYRREQPQGGGAFGGWEQAGMPLETHALLSNQSQRREIEYRIIGVNSAGISVPSNTAAVVL